MSSWFCYVDDTFTFIKEGEIESVKESLNGFHEDINFTYEVETDGKLPFLDVNVTRKEDGSFDTDVYCKKTDSNIYISWDAFASRSWKVGTLKGLLRRAFSICSTKESQDKEIKFLKHVFTKINGYPSRVVNNTIYEVRNKMESEIQQQQQQQQQQRQQQQQQQPQQQQQQQQQRLPQQSGEQHYL